MTKCHYCGAELPAHARFCGRCGQAQVVGASQGEERFAPTLIHHEEGEGQNLARPVSPAQPPAPPAISERTTAGSGEEEQEWSALPLFPVPTPGPTDIASAPTGLLDQPSQSYPLHQQPTPFLGPHRQPEQVYGPHHQPFAPHQQPTPLHGPHQQPQPLHGLHQQPQPFPTGHAVGVGAKAAGAGAKVGGSVLAKWLIVTVVAALVLAGGATTYILTRPAAPQPSISITSKYNVNNVPAAASGTSLHISGQNFSSNSPITFLRDGQPLTSAPKVSSDKDGKISADLPITDDWSIGRHTVTARDGGNNTTNSSITVTIVEPGQAHTNGPNGAPPDDQSFNLTLSLQMTLDDSGSPLTGQLTLIVTGHADPQGGTVCTAADDGQEHTSSGTTFSNGRPYNETLTTTCSGTYKQGKITYTEKMLKDTVVLTDDNSTCTLNGARDVVQISGEFTAQHTFSGTVVGLAIPQEDYTCNQANESFQILAAHGTWTGTIDNGTQPGTTSTPTTV